MLQKRFHHPNSTQYEYLSDPNLLSLWSASGKDWSCLIQQNCLEAKQQAIQPKESTPKSISILVFLGVLTALGLWSASMCTLALEVHKAVQDSTLNQSFNKF